jgi:hypothetical protein
MRTLLAAGLALFFAAVSCAETPSDTGGQAECACPEEVCPQGQCVLKIVVADPCWGEAKVFVGETGPTAQPVGTATLETPFTTCDAFDAPIADETTGETVQEAEAFEFVIESEDGRAVAGSVSGQTFACAGSAPFVFTAQGCQ